MTTDMTVDVRDGWLHGDIDGVKVHRDPESPFYPLAGVKPNLVLHTTETSRIASWDYPPQFTVGEGVIVQHKPLWAKGESLRGDTTNDPYAMQIEIVGYSKLDVWLPGPVSLIPLVALMAWLQRTGNVRTALGRPYAWPVKLDRGPQAVTTYYRRNQSLWPQTAGVYGHVEIPGNTHWDPGSLDYPTLFDKVRSVLEGDDDMGFAEFKEGWKRHRRGDPRPGDNGDPDVTFGWNARAEAVSKPAPIKGDPGEPGAPGMTQADADARYASKDHPHGITGRTL